MTVFVHPLTRGVAGAIALALIWIALLYHDSTVRLMFRELHMNDFGKFYYSARQFLDGRDMYAPNAATSMPVGEGRHHEFLNLNPPHFHLPILPLATLTPKPALAVWAIGSVAALLWSIALIVREIRPRLSALRALWLLTALMLSAALSAVVITGQISLLLMLNVTLAWAAARRGQWCRAGVWLGLLVSVKAFALIFVPWLIARRAWPALTAMAAVITLILATGLAVFGVDAYAAWLRALEATDWSWAAMNASVLGLLSRGLAESPYYTPLLRAPDLVRPIWFSTAAVVGVLTLASAIRERNAEDTDHAFAVLILGALLVSPLGWVYYWWLAAPALGAMPTVRRHWLFRTALPFMFVPLALVVGQRNAWATLTVGSSYFWGTLLVWVAVLLTPVANAVRFQRPR